MYRNLRCHCLFRGVSKKTGDIVYVDASGDQHPTLFSGLGQLPELTALRCQGHLPLAMVCMQNHIESLEAGYHNVKLASLKNGRDLQKRREIFAVVYSKCVEGALGKLLG